MILNKKKSHYIPIYTYLAVSGPQQFQGSGSFRKFLWKFQSSFKKTLEKKKENKNIFKKISYKK